MLKGSNLVASTYWHGVKRTDWANRWVPLWTGGQGNFVSTSSPDGGRIGALTALARAGKVDLQRVLQLHATMNLSMQAPSMTALDSVKYDTPKRPHPGKALALSHTYAVGGPVLHELLKNWPCYRDEIPGTAKKQIPARRQCTTFPRSLARMRDTRPFRSAAATHFENCSPPASTLRRASAPRPGARATSGHRPAGLASGRDRRN